ncbi:hypothetical protein KEM55_000201, partial [Ascosphaera atra]
VDEVQEWLLNRFDELNASSRLLAEFKRIRQTTDVQQYWNEFHIAYNLSGAKWDEQLLMTHLVDFLKPDLQIEWKRAGHDNSLEPDEILRELIRLEDVLNSKQRFDNCVDRPRQSLNVLSSSSRGLTIQSTGTAKVAVTFDSLKFVIDVVIIGDLGYDIILGRSWLASQMPQINWRTSDLTITQARPR